MAEVETESREKVKSLLKELFQFDTQDLDFGIYRIMNFKRKEIEKFIEEDLIKAAEEEFKEYARVGMVDLQKEIEKLRAEIVRDFGEGTIDEQGNVKKHEDAPKIKEYLSKRKELEDAKLSQAQIDDVFNHVYEFFSRYYDNGDFLSKRRYGGREKYFVPYNGEEVLLHWANNDQYYVKSGEYFKKYDFKAGGYRVNFVLKDAEAELNDVKDEPKYFLLCDEDIFELNEERKELNIFFNWRTLADEEKEKYGTRNVQETTTSEAVKRLLSEIGKKASGIELRRKMDEEKTLLEIHLKKYVEKNTSDYFIHKSLKTFLERELDFYIKNEVLDLDEIESMDERRIRLDKAKMRAIKEISRKVIEFLAQIENFQKMLFEKKKFIIGTEYVITLDRIKELAGEEFLKSILDEVLMNSKQVKEWKDLFEINVKNKRDLTEKQTVTGNEWKRLPIDTSNFDREFKTRLMEKLSGKNDLEEILDGILVKSENWQALNLILGKFKERIQCIYIDPPFNTGTNEFLYKNNYLDSSWASMICDRLALGRRLLGKDGNIYVRIDYHGNFLIRMLMDSLFGKDEFRNEIAVNRIRKNVLISQEQKAFPTALDSVFFYVVNENVHLIEITKEIEVAREGFWRHMDDSAGRGPPRTFFGKTLEPPRGKHWKYSQENVERLIQEGKLRLECKNCGHIHTSGLWKGCPKCGKDDPRPKYWVEPSQTIVLDTDWTDIPGYSSNWKFPTENSEQLLERIIKASSREGDWILDYFLGSGTTAAVAHKLRRKWVGVEMGEFFENIPLMRMKMVLAGDCSGISKKLAWQGGGFFKYHYVEQYEDTLNNIVFREKDKTIQETLDSFQDYFLRYMLDYETRDSPTRLTTRKFQTPFDYKIKTVNGTEEKEQNVDLVETFNYLLGLNVSKIRIFNDDQRIYHVAYGKRNNDNTVIIWRNTKDLDLQKDKKFIEEKVLSGNTYDLIFINGDSYVTNATAIEPEFKKLIGA